MKLVRLKAVAAAGAIAVFALSACSQKEDNSEAASKTEELSPFYTEVVEGYPTEMIERNRAFEKRLMEAADESAATKSNNVPFSSVVIRDYYRWEPGTTVTVAFQRETPDAGTQALREQIEQIAKRWTAKGIADLDLSFRTPDGRFREWDVTDTTYAADIRLSYGRKGNWSQIGRFSNQPQVTPPSEPSMNLKNFDLMLPGNWKRVVTHEFGHALGFAHEQQNTFVECGFRFDNDPGYVPTRRGPDGPFIPDGEHRRPGLITWFSGPPNGWDEAKVRANLMTIGKTSAYRADDFLFTPFDKFSIMKYYFGPEYFINGSGSPCYLADESNDLSPDDKIAAAKAYHVVGGNASLRQSLQALANSRSLPMDVRRGAQQRIRNLEK